MPLQTYSVSLDLRRRGTGNDSLRLAVVVSLAYHQTNVRLTQSESSNVLVFVRGQLVGLEYEDSARGIYPIQPPPVHAHDKPHSSTGGNT